MRIDDAATLDEIVIRVRAGDREAYRHIVEACEASMRVVVAAILPQELHVEDVVQDAFVTAYAKLAEYQTGTNVLAWLKTIARYMALNERRRYCREQRRLGHRGARILEAVSDDVAAIADGAPDCLLKTLQHCVDQLGQAAKGVVNEFYWSGSSAETIAGSMGKNVNWVRVVLHRARATLADCIQRGGPHER